MSRASSFITMTTMTTGTKTDRVAVSDVMSEGTMDRLISAAWRAFWIGLGASAVFVGQSLLAPEPKPASAADIAPSVHEAAPSYKAPVRTNGNVVSKIRTRAPHAS